MLNKPQHDTINIMKTLHCVTAKALYDATNWLYEIKNYHVLIPQKVCAVETQLEIMLLMPATNLSKSPYNVIKNINISVA